MIRNIVFDLGNVLISFRPAEYLDKCNYEDRLKPIILKDVFASPFWLMLDNGDLTTREAIERIAANSTLKRELIDDIFNRRIDILSPIPSNQKLLPELKKAGFRLFYLSNFPEDIWILIRNGFRKTDYEFLNYFDGGLISAESRLSKPDIRFYHVLLEKYSMKAEECLYLDDLEANVKSAEIAGMKGFTTFGSHEISGEVKKILGI